MDSALNDPKSYESVSFSKLYKLKDTIDKTFENKPDTVKYNGSYTIMHIYRSKSGFGGIITKTDWFEIDSSLTTVFCCHIPYSYYK